MELKDTKNKNLQKTDINIFVGFAWIFVKINLCDFVSLC